MSIFIPVVIALLVTVGMALVRTTLGPTVFDRVQSANTVGTCAMLLRPQAAITPARLEALLEALHHSGELQRIFEPYGVQVKAHVTDR